VEANSLVAARPADTLLPAAARAPSLSAALDSTPRREADLVARRPVLGSRGGGLATGDATTLAAARPEEESLRTAVRAPSLSAVRGPTPRREADLVIGPSVRGGGGGTRILLVLLVRAPATALACSGTGVAGVFFSLPRADDRVPFGGAAVTEAAAVGRASFFPLPRVDGWLSPAGVAGSRDTATRSATGSPSFRRPPARAAARRRAAPRVTGPLGAVAAQRAGASRSTCGWSATSSSPEVEGDRKDAPDGRPSARGVNGS